MYTLVDIPGLVQPPATVSANQSRSLSGCSRWWARCRPGAVCHFRPCS